MRRLASEIIRELEARVARLERQASNHRVSSSRYADPFLAELQADIDAGMIIADDIVAGRNPWGGDSKNQESYNSPPAPKNQADCYSPSNWEGLGKPGQGETCYRLHHEYGSAKSGKPGSAERKKYNKKWRDELQDSPTYKRTGPLPGSNIKKDD